MFQVPTVLTDTSIRNEVFTRIDALGSKLGVAAAHIWGVLVRQSYADAAENFAWAGAMFIVALISYTAARWGFSRPISNADGKSANYSWDDQEVLVAIFGTIGAVATTLIFFACLTSGLKEVINPEFYAWSTITSWFQRR